MIGRSTANPQKQTRARKQAAPIKPGRKLPLACPACGSRQLTLFTGGGEGNAHATVLYLTCRRCDATALLEVASENRGAYVVLRTDVLPRVKTASASVLDTFGFRFGHPRLPKRKHSAFETKAEVRLPKRKHYLPIYYLHAGGRGRHRR